MSTQIRIRALAHGGDGVGSATDETGPTWFVPGTIPGEVVEAELVQSAKRFNKGRVLSIIEPSPRRVAPPCGLADRCGGCGWQHIEPVAQPEFKARVVADQLRKVPGGDAVRVGFAGTALGYRRRARMHYRRDNTGALHLGYFAARTKDVVDVPSCPVLDPVLDRAFAKLRGVVDVLGEQGEIVGITDGRKALIGLPSLRPVQARLERLETILDEELVGVRLRGGRQRGGVGTSWLEIDASAGMPGVRVSPFSFAQAQAGGNRALVEHVARSARCEGKRVLELFAGAGNLTRALAKVAMRVWASERDKDAAGSLAELAKAGLPINGKKQNALHLLPKLADSMTEYDVVVVDPPRTGLGEEATAAACRVASERIVYVSCDPATLARDLAVATANGFVVDDISIFDLMPMTPEVEIVATLVRGGGAR